MAGESPYAGAQSRDIKALPEASIEGYLDGAGMGDAKAAELNGYPGPMHVLELAGRLDLSDEQREATRALVEQVKERARALGRELVARERELDRLFAADTVDEAELRSLVESIAAVEGELRRVHLQAHLEQRHLLTARQVEIYNRERGYAGPRGQHHHGH